MGSSQAPDGNAPFGYHVSDQDFLFLRAPTPPPGDPLLTQDDNRALNLFFEDMTTNHYPGMSYGEGLNFSEQWISQLPPAFLGHTTSFGQQPQQPSASLMNGMPATTYQDVFTFGQSMMPPPPTPSQPSLQLEHTQHQHHNTPTPHTPIEQSAHADVAAVLTSLHHGHQNGHQSGANGINRAPVVPSQHNGSHVDQMRPLPRNHIPDQSNTIHRRHTSNDADTLFTDMVFGNSHGIVNQRPIEAPELQWGSDSNFARTQGYVPPDHESSELLEQKRLGALRVLTISHSAATTRPPSPSTNGEGSSVARPDINANGHIKEELDVEAPPAKRRKSKSKGKLEVDDVENSTSVPSKAVARKRKSKPDLKATPDTPSATPDAPGKRRKSTLNSGKAPRENLTDSQKRENHIKSEQKRRGAIKEGFDDLSELVPNLKGGGYSKSTMLTIAGEWLEALLKGNEELERL
ncbi:uncharacterized protein F4807DRAFT_459451 [Annulohypoxylon truncatum]|uniref:uncharacterized protein n=1 Tax=Annulohypoxylon truncatum TaxID=327061 RepID=UPI002007CB2F|nr:uncharacterized protein F4807DRAFT_459451 [Annulohypoxylon truncatum]KAI1210609.1 hypothetical protein F4807DRAFT_459451 [Annulohypoxylon truncatum]